MNLNNLNYDELRGDLIAFEKTHLSKKGQEDTKKKTVAFKSDQEDKGEDELEENEIALITRLVMESFRRSRNNRRGRNFGKEKYIADQSRNDGKCYECEKYGHIASECTEAKKTHSRGHQKNKALSSWSDEENSENEHEEIGNICFMAVGELSTEVSSSKGSSDGNYVSCNQSYKSTESKANSSKPKGNPDNSNLKGPKKIWYLKEDNDFVLQELRRKTKGKWYMDTGCSNHITGDKNLFKSVAEYKAGSIRFSDNSKGTVIGIGTITFNDACDITNVYLVAGLKYNLLSISQLCDSNLEVRFQKNKCLIEDHSRNNLLQGSTEKNVYILDSVKNNGEHICLASMSDDPWIWHKKLGHASREASQNDLVIGLPKLDYSKDHICDACQMGKQTRNSFSSKDTVSTNKPIQLLHEDLFRPTRIASIGGKRMIL
ncbi:hypothetical protein KY289_030907 [Solanum tuberosum]|nr:hypothetical protein KY289_030907 [Solanum tuberosum]